MESSSWMRLEEFKTEDSGNEGSLEDVTTPFKERRLTSFSLDDKKSIISTSNSNVSSTSCEKINEVNVGVHIYTNRLSYERKINSSYMKSGSKYKTGTTTSSIGENLVIENKENVNAPVLIKNICLKRTYEGKQKNYFDKLRSFFLASFYIRKWEFNRNLFINGVVTFMLSILLLVGHIDYKTLITNSEYVEGKLGLHITASIMVICAGLSIITARAPKRPLASFVLLFSLICFAFCIISLVYLLGEVNVNLNRLQACWFNNIDDSCTCYTKEQSGFKTFRFSKVANCEVIKGQLRQLVYGVTITFAIGCLISLIAVVTTGYLLCKNQRWKCTTERHEEDSSPPPTPRNVRSLETQTEECSFITPARDFISPYCCESPEMSPEVRHAEKSRTYHFGEKPYKEDFADEPFFSRATSTECESEESSILGYPLNPPTYDDAIKRKC